MVVGVRQVNDSDLPSQGWVNTHLQYTHGYGMILAPANNANSHQPVFDISQVPAQSSPGAPKITQPRVYFGVSNPGATPTTSWPTPANRRSTTRPRAARTR